MFGKLKDLIGLSNMKGVHARDKKIFPHIKVLYDPFISFPTRKRQIKLGKRNAERDASTFVGRILWHTFSGYWRTSG